MKEVYGSPGEDMTAQRADQPQCRVCHLFRSLREVASEGGRVELRSCFEYAMAGRLKEVP